MATEVVNTRLRIRSLGSCLQFNGVDNYVKTSTLVSNVTDNFAVMAWFKLVSQPTTTAIIVQNGRDGGGSANGYALTVLDDLTIRAQFGFVNTWNTGILADIGIWTHFLLTRVNGVSQMYVNGQPQGSTWSNNPFVPTNDLQVGAGLGVDNVALRWFPGSVNEVALFESGFSATDVLNVYYRGLMNQPNQKLYFKFDDGAGTTTVDSSGNGKTGTFVNSPVWSSDGFITPRIVAQPI